MCRGTANVRTRVERSAPREGRNGLTTFLGGTSGTGTAAAVPGTDAELTALLRLARAHLCMEVVWISHFGEGQQSVLAAEGDAESLALIADESWPAITSLYVKVSAQQRSPVISQSRRQTHGLPGLGPMLGVSVTVCVPLVWKSSQAIGGLCCLRRTATEGDADDIADVQRFMEMMSEPVIAHLQGPAALAAAADLAEAARVRCILRGEALRMVFQPVVQLQGRIPVAYEALARFQDPWSPTPAHAFLAAERAGLGV